MNMINTKYILCTLIVLTVITSCSNKQEVAPIIDPANNPLATFTPMGDYSNITEGDTLEFEITVDKLFDQDIDFSVILDESSSGTEEDYLVRGGIFTALTTSTTLSIIFLNDNVQEEDETFDLEISAAEDIGYSFQLNPDSKLLLSLRVTE